jgi:hypothetical protein
MFTRLRSPLSFADIVVPFDLSSVRRGAPESAKFDARFARPFTCARSRVTRSETTHRSRKIHHGSIRHRWNDDVDHGIPFAVRVATAPPAVIRMSARGGEAVMQQAVAEEFVVPLGEVRQAATIPLKFEAPSSWFSTRPPSTVLMRHEMLERLSLRAAASESTDSRRFALNPSVS